MAKFKNVSGGRVSIVTDKGKTFVEKDEVVELMVEYGELDAFEKVVSAKKKDQKEKSDG